MIDGTDKEGFDELWYKGNMSKTQYLMSNLTVFELLINPLWIMVVTPSMTKVMAGVSLEYK